MGASERARDNVRNFRPEDIVTAAQVEQAIMETKVDLKNVRDEIEDRMVEAALAESEYKRAYHVQRLLSRDLTGHGPGDRVTNEEAEDYAVTAVIGFPHGDLLKPDRCPSAYIDPRGNVDLMTRRLVGEALATVSRDTLKALTSQMDGLRTIAANIRAQS